MMKKSLFVFLLATLAACSGPTDVKLSEMNEPENAKKLMEVLSPQDRAALQGYVVEHTVNNTIDYKVTVKQAIADYKKEAEQKEKMRNAIK